MDKTRSTLFFEIARAIKQIQPRLLLLENVKGLLSQGGGQTFRVILSTLVGYDVEWQVLNSQDFSVPQHRERVYLVGHLRGKSRRKIFPLERKVREVHLEERKNRGSALQDGQVAATV